MTSAEVGREVRIEVAVPERVVARVFREGISPSEFLEFLVRSVQLEKWLARFPKGEGAKGRSGTDQSALEVSGLHHQIGASAYHDLLATVSAEVLPGIEGTTWTDERVARFLEVICADRELSDTNDLLRAYALLGPNPTSAELQKTCGFLNNREWFQQLRIAKAKLTLQCRRMGLPPLFQRPQTVDGARFHPLEPSAYPYLKGHLRTSSDSFVDPSKWGRRTKDAPRGPAKK
jgi:hypothetical protein